VHEVAKADLSRLVETGGLMAYGPDTAMMFWRAAEYLDKIVKGALPSYPSSSRPKYVLTVSLKSPPRDDVVLGDLPSRHG
jgi:hypothetical protein